MCDHNVCVNVFSDPATHRQRFIHYAERHVRSRRQQPARWTQRRTHAKGASALEPDSEPTH